MSELIQSRQSAERMGRWFDALPDPADFRDRLFEPTLVEVPERIDVEAYQREGVPVLDQGVEGACTGFALATVANCLLRRRKVEPDPTPVSPRMFYEMARRCDEWAGEAYSGSSARGAMKGWHKYGVCSQKLAPYKVGEKKWRLKPTQAEDARKRPLGAYYRVNPKDLVALHAALVEAGILYATANVHMGWHEPGRGARIHKSPELLGGHAFAVVAYDAEGLWVQNSWGKDWGVNGLAHLSYEDWLENALDLWVARLAAPVILSPAIGAGASRGAGRAEVFSDVRPHIVSVGNDGRLRESGLYGNSKADLQNIFRRDLPAKITEWGRPRLLFYAHGGLVSEKAAIQRVVEYSDAVLRAGVYPMAFIWKSDYWTTLGYILQDAVRRRKPEGLLDAAKDFMLDRLDDALEAVARRVTGRSSWREMKENALAATTGSQGAARIVAGLTRELVNGNLSLELHIVAHSAGSILMAPFIQLLTGSGRISSGPMKGQRGLGLQVASCTLWAPACTIELFKATYLPVIKAGNLKQFALYTLTDKDERDDHCAHIYHKSLPYLVSNAFEERAGIAHVRKGTPLLGMEKFVDQDDELCELFALDTCRHIRAYLDKESEARHHGDFDDDDVTLQSTLARILGRPAPEISFSFDRSASRAQEWRQALGTE